MKKTNVKFRYVSLAVFILLFFSVPANSATYYMGSGENFTTLESAVAAMSGGDTLIIRDGVYGGSENVLDESHMPPSGTSVNPTVIRAENDGGAIFPDSFIKMTGPANSSYIDFVGLKALSGTSVSYNTTHFRFFRCAFTSTNAGQTDNSTFAISGTYHLIEDCWAWGEGRYGMYATASAYTHHIVFRRCVVRMDKLNAYSPIAALHTYGVSQVAFQNCIVLDGDERFWLNYEEKGPAYYNHNAPLDIYVDGSIALNYPSYFSGGTPGTNFVIRNSAAVDLANGLVIDMKNTSPDDFEVDHLTAWNTDSIGVQAKNIVGGSWPVTNSIIYGNSSVGLNGWGMSSDYNVLYANPTDYVNPTAGINDYSASNSNAIDPFDGTPGNGTACVLYPVRLEIDSNCDGTGIGGTDRGAEILKRIGVSGTVWGEAGWDTVTSVDLWPWPNEYRIKVDVASYSYTGVDRYGALNQTLSGARGFAASGTQLDGTSAITLTSYIWEYLGNPIPPEIYGDSPPVTEPPVTDFVVLQDFEDGILWVPAGNQDPTGNGRGWSFFDAGSQASIEIDSSQGANNTQNSLKVTFDSNDPQLYFKSDTKSTDNMPEAAGANRMSFYVKFPANFQIQPLPYRYKTWEFGTFIHDPADWYDDAAIRHFYHFLTMEQVGDGWVKYILTTRPDHERDMGTDVPADMSYYYDNFGRFYFHFGPEAGGPTQERPFTIWIDEIKFYFDDGTVGGQIHDGGVGDAGYDGEFFPNFIVEPASNLRVNL